MATKYTSLCDRDAGIGLLRLTSQPSETDQLCCCKDPWKNRHVNGFWCARGDSAHLLRPVRAYLMYLHSKGALTDDMDNARRRELLSVIYHFVFWMTNGENGRKPAAPLLERGTWLEPILRDAVEIGVPVKVYPASAEPYSRLVKLARERGVPLQARLPPAPTHASLARDLSAE